MTSVTVTGADQLARTLRTAAAQLARHGAADMAAARLAQAAARPPRRSGALARSATVTRTPTGAVVAWTAAYAAHVHDGTRYLAARPWTVPAAAAAVGPILAVYTQHTENALATIQGV